MWTFCSKFSPGQASAQVLPAWLEGSWRKSRRWRERRQPGTPVIFITSGDIEPRQEGQARQLPMGSMSPATKQPEGGYRKAALPRPFLHHSCCHSCAG